MYYFESSSVFLKAGTIKELKDKIKLSTCESGEIYKGSQLYAIGKRVKKYNVSCGSWYEWEYKRTI